MRAEFGQYAAGMWHGWVMAGWALGMERGHWDKSMCARTDSKQCPARQSLKLRVITVGRCACRMCVLHKHLLTIQCVSDTGVVTWIENSLLPRVPLQILI